MLYKQTLRTGGVGLAPIGRFYLNQTDSFRGLPFLKLDRNISWPSGLVPLDQPVCGFQGELCSSDDYCDIAIGVVGGLVGVMLVVGGVAYRNWRYEQGICYLQSRNFIILCSTLLGLGIYQWETLVILWQRDKKEMFCE